MHRKREARRRERAASAAAVISLWLTGLPLARPAIATERAALKQLRYDEDWHTLCHPENRNETLDTIKCIPLSADAATYLTVGGEIRPYYELYDNEDWGAVPNEDGWLLQRYMLHADLHVGPHFRVFGQLKSGLEDGRDGRPRPTDKDELDLNQAFFDVSADVGHHDALRVRIGRQELSFGSSRLISAREGPNVRQTFDGFRASLRAGEWTVDTLATQPVKTESGVFDDSRDHTRALWGVYAAGPLSLLPLDGHIDLYYLGYYRKEATFEQGDGRERRHTLGTRLWNPRGSFDYNFELVYQLGTFDGDQDGDIRAWTVASDTGYTFQRVRLRPRAGLKANVTSGDKDPDDRDLETFNPMFPKGAYFGQLSPVGPLNHYDLHPNLELTFPHEVSLTLDWVFYWRQSDADAVYDVPGNIQRPGSQSSAHYIGHQPGLEVEWTLGRHTTITADYAHFFAGPFLHDTPPDKDIGYFAAWVTYKF